MFKARGQPGCWYGYADVVIDGKQVTIKIDAQHVGKGAAKHFEGAAKRHVKADQQTLPLEPGGEACPECGQRWNLHAPTCSHIMHRLGQPPTAVAHAPARRLLDTGFDDDELPEDL